MTEEQRKPISKKSKARALKSEIDSLKDLYSKISFISQKVSNLDSGKYYTFGDKKLGHQQLALINRYFKSRLDGLSEINKVKRQKEANDVVEVKERLSYYSEDLINFFKNANLGCVYDEQGNPTDKKLRDELNLFFHSRLGYFRKGLTKLLSIYNRVNNTQEVSIKGKPYKITELEWKYFKNILEKDLKKKPGDHLSVTEFSVIISQNRIKDDNIPENIREMIKDKEVIEKALNETRIINHTLESIKRGQK